MGQTNGSSAGFGVCCRSALGVVLGDSGEVGDALEEDNFEGDMRDDKSFEVDRVDREDVP